MQVGSDDQARAYLNGREVYRIVVPRSLESLDTAGPLTLERGTNVLVLKAVNIGWSWEACARLVDEEGRPVEDLRVRLSPGTAASEDHPRHAPANAVAPDFTLRPGRSVTSIGARHRLR